MSSAPPNPWLRIFLPFAAGYFLSYMLRTVNAVIAPDLARELNLSAADLGFLTSAYFLSFGLFQLPLGLLLDRYGARRVDAVLLVFAAAGALCFGLSHNMTGLVIGRALIGLGVSACLMAALKCLFEWFPADRHASLTGTIMTSGALGALSSSVPLQWTLPLMGWRGVFLSVAALTVLVVVAVSTIPDKAVRRPSESLAEQLQALGRIFASGIFWRYGLQMAFISGGSMSIQGLWAVPWMLNVEQLTRSAAADHLFFMSLAMLLGYLGIAFLSTWLLRRGIGPGHVLGAGNSLWLLSALAILVGAPGGAALWFLLGLGGSTVTLGYSLLGVHFPPHLSGRTSTALNLLAFAGAFGIQWGFGGIVDALTAGGWAVADAYRAAFACQLILAAGGFGWYLLGARTSRLAPSHG